MNTSKSRWLDFFSGINTIIINNETEFNKFKNFLSDVGLEHLLGKDKNFSDWQYLSKINNKPLEYIIFEYQVGKGITFGYTKKASLDWYGENPMTIDVIDNFYQNSSLYKKINNALQQAKYCLDAHCGNNSEKKLDLLCDSDLESLVTILDNKEDEKEITEDLEEIEK